MDIFRVLLLLTNIYFYYIIVAILYSKHLKKNVICGLLP